MVKVIRDDPNVYELEDGEGNGKKMLLEKLLGHGYLKMIYKIWLKDLMNKLVEEYPEYDEMDDDEIETEKRLLKRQQDIGMW